METYSGSCSKHGPFELCGHTDANCSEKINRDSNFELTVNEDAFSDSLVPTEFDARNVSIWGLKGNDSVLIRETKIEENQVLDELEASMRAGEKLFAEMKQKYGINVISMQIKREKNKLGKETIFTVVDKIEGQNLSEIETLPAESKDELEELYVSLGRYYYDAWKQKLKYWGDARNDQFVYGSKSNEEGQHFYLTDVDPEFYQEGEDEWHTIEAVFASVCHDLIQSEDKFKPRIRLKDARERLLSIIEEMLGVDNNQKMLVEAKGWLEN